MKTKTKTVHTLSYSTIFAKEHIQFCPDCNAKYRSKELLDIVKPGRNYGYGCMVEVGLLRYIEKRQIDEIKIIFDEVYKIPISLTHVRKLSYEFLLYLGKYHYLNTKRINENLKRNGGYILHIDSTCEGRKPHLLTCIDSLSEIVLYCEKISSENEVEIKAVFEKVKLLFGTPLCMVHDMGSAFCKCGAMVFSGVMQIICHFHFLRDIGKDFFASEYTELKKALSIKKIYSLIRYQIRALEKKIGNKDIAEQLVHKIAKNELNSLSSKVLLQGILYGYLLILKSHENLGDGYGLPFDRPKLLYFNKMKDIFNEITVIENDELFSKEVKFSSRFYKIKAVLKEVVEDTFIKDTVGKLENKLPYFDKLREIMKIALVKDKKGLNDEGNIISTQDVKDMELEMSEYVQMLNSEVQKEKNKIDFSPLTKQLKKYWDKIFVKPIIIKTSEGEKTIIPNRTNNICEQYYRSLKQLFRRLHGRKSVEKDLKYLPEEIALIGNLKNKQYIKNLLGNIDNLKFEFAKIDQQNLELPFERKQLDVFVSQKLLKTVSNFKPLNCINSFKNMRNFVRC